MKPRWPSPEKVWSIILGFRKGVHHPSAGNYRPQPVPTCFLFLIGAFMLSLALLIPGRTRQRDGAAFHNGRSLLKGQAQVSFTAQQLASLAHSVDPSLMEAALAERAQDAGVPLAELKAALVRVLAADRGGSAQPGGISPESMQQSGQTENYVDVGVGNSHLPVLRVATDALVAAGAEPRGVGPSRGTGPTSQLATASQILSDSSLRAIAIAALFAASGGAVGAELEGGGALSGGSSEAGAAPTLLSGEDEGGHALAAEEAAERRARAANRTSDCGPLFDPVEDEERVGSFRRLTWLPRPGKFLLMYCVRGQISNRALCMRNHLLLAALLNRTLVVPQDPWEQQGRHYNLRLVWDLARARQCLGPDSVLSTREYEARYGRNVTVDVIQCWQGPMHSCPDNPQLLDLDCPGRIRPGHEIWTTKAAPTRQASVTLVLDPQSHMAALFGPRGRPAERRKVSVYGSCMGTSQGFETVVEETGAWEDPVLAVGDLVDHRLKHPLLPSPFFERVVRVLSSCPPLRAVFSPKEALMARGTRIAEEMFGGKRRYLGVHWRRGDFGWFCFTVVKTGRCFYSPRQAANCTVRTAQRHGLRHVFLATNARKEEVAAFVQHVAKMSRGQMKVQTFPKKKLGRDLVEGADKDGEQAALVEVLMDKIVASLSTVFLGTVESTFTKDIVSMRYGMKTISCHDSYVCNEEPEWEDDAALKKEYKKNQELLVAEKKKKKKK